MIKIDISINVAMKSLYMIGVDPSSLGMRLVTLMIKNNIARNRVTERANLSPDAAGKTKDSSTRISRMSGGSKRCNHRNKALLFMVMLNSIDSYALFVTLVLSNLCEEFINLQP